MRALRRLSDRPNRTCRGRPRARLPFLTPRAGAIVTALACTAALLAPRAAPAQLVPVRTVPVATGDQFLVHPSERLGMGGVSIALDDRLLDPFLNPAKGARLEEHRFLVSPVFYGISDDGGGGKTLPMALLLASDTWFGGLSLALQEVDRADRFISPLPLIDSSVLPPDPLPGPGFDKSGTNTYLSGFVGHRIGGSPVSLGAGFSWAGLSVVQGVEHLFPRSTGLEQSGHTADFRVGLVADWAEDRTLEAVVVHHRVDVMNEIQRLVFTPDASPVVCVRAPCGEWRLQSVESPDRTNTTGLHLGYRAPLGEEGWRIGGTLTVNRKDHPKIPNYELMDIPRDPGDTWAWAFGAGIARESRSGTVYGVDLLFQPIWSETWAEAEDPVVAEDGEVVAAAGERTVENDFTFSNVTLRMGAGHAFEWGGVQAGLEVRSIDYRLEQFDAIEGSRRTEDEGWLEWTPSWGASFDLPELSVRYDGRFTTGTGRPGVLRGFGPQPAGPEGDLATGGIDFLPAGSGPLTVQEAVVFTHRVTVSIPIR